MENADTYDAPRPPGDAGQGPPTPDGPSREPRHLLDGLFDGHDSSKEAILSFITTGRAPKDGAASLRDLFVALSALPTPGDEKNHGCNDMSSNAANKDDDDNNNNKNSTNTTNNNKNDYNEHNEAIKSASLPSIPVPKPLSPSTTPQAALPPTPKPDEHTAQDLFDGTSAEPDLKKFFISLLASGKIAPEKVKKLFDISTLAASEDFAGLMEYGKLYGGLRGQLPHFTMQAAFAGAVHNMQSPQEPAPAIQDVQGPQSHRQPTPHAQSPFQQPPSFDSQGLEPTTSAFEPAAANNDGSLTPALNGSHQRQGVMNSYVAPDALAHQSGPPLLPTDGSYNSALTGASTPSGQSGHDMSAAATFDRQGGLPSPVVTQASSNKSDGSATPTGNMNLTNGADPSEVICPLNAPDGSVCGKRCQGAKPYRSIQEHIRRAHPGRYLPGLPATEESFHAMVDSEGIVCPINKPDGSECGYRCTGSKPYRSMQDHIREQHADRFVPGLPANEASFRIMVEKSACVVCPLETADGALCNKRCFGEKRYRSIQEHIRRAHPEHYLPGLHANEESFRKMTSGVASAPPPAALTSETNGRVAPTPDEGLRRDSHGQASLAASSSPVSRPEEKAAVAAIGINGSQSFAPQVWHPPPQETVGTVSPALLTMSDIQQAGFAQPLSPYLAYSFQQQQAFQPFAHAYMQQPQSLTGLPLGAACLQDPDPTLTRDLFNPQPQTQALHQDPRAYSTVYEYAQAMQTNLVSASGFVPAAGIDIECTKSSSEKRKLDGPNGPNSDGKRRPAKKSSLWRGNDEPLAAKSSSRPSETNGSHVLQSKKAVSPAKSRQNGAASPFFTANSSGAGGSPVSTSGPKTSSRPARNTVSALSVPPLSENDFGLVQETLAHDPFRLLIATVFLTRTSGRVSMPVFHEVMERWQTPAELATADPETLKSMIHKLGLAERRCEIIQKMAAAWTRQPPSKDVRFGIRDYPCKGDGKDVRSGEAFGPEDQQTVETPAEPQQANAYGEGAVKTKARGHGVAWEIGHLTLGSYAIDSWRIFCRDVLLGRAEDWKGKGREPTFQPEWMRVQPNDKELRAYLRWMWMKEGWWWDPQTGEKQVLSEEMRVAVNERRVDYDNEGSLYIAEPRRDAAVGMVAGTVSAAGALFASG